MNKVALLGRLTRDPEVRTANGANGTMTTARYTLAVDRRIKKEGEQTADFINCIAFSKSAEFAEKYLHQGTKIAVIGHIQTGSYTNKDGVKVYTTDVIIDEQEFAESKAVNGTQGTVPQAPSNSNNFMSIPDNVDDGGLPFN